MCTKTALVHGKLPQAMFSSITVGLHNNPSRGITNPKIQDFALLDKHVEGLHQLRYVGSVVPAVNMELFSVSLKRQ
jgi:hypothetical protein